MDASETLFFEAPSGNIACSMVGPNAVCEIRQHTFEQPERPSDCDLDYGTMVGVEGQAAGAFLCHGDTAFFADSSVLGYGQRISNGLVSCTSTGAMMACSDASGTHGFELSRARYRVY